MFQCINQALKFSVIDAFGSATDYWIRGGAGQTPPGHKFEINFFLTFSIWHVQSPFQAHNQGQTPELYIARKARRT
jgi:hypothetical protein